MLDTFEKRLASQGTPLPGGISERDRWSIGGGFRPSVWVDGGAAIALAVAVAAFSGTFTAGTPPDVSGKLIASLSAASASLRGATTDGSTALSAQDRYHVEGLPFPGAGATVRDRYAIAGSFTRLVQGSSSSSGAIAATAAAVSSSVRGFHAASIFFNPDYSLTPAFSFSVMPGRDGAWAQTLATVTIALRGTALPPNSVAGFVQPVLGSALSSLRGTMTAPAARDGKVHSDASAVATSLRGSVVPPQGVIGKVALTAGSVTASFAGTFTAWSTDGHIGVSLENATFHGFGQPLQPGDIYGFIRTTADNASAALVGSSASLVSNPPVIRAPGSKRVIRLPKSNRVVRDDD